MIKICDYNACTGCRACENVCSQKAITFHENIKGFSYPKISVDLCINCGMCKKNCVVNYQHKHLEKGKVYACWNVNKKERLDSTSGGIFRLLSEKILDEGGIVYGAGFDNNMVVHHMRIEEKKNLYKLLGSKYVQSDIKGIYQKVRADLENGKKVLFSGVACQVSALKNYLKKDYDNLLCVDILCHGVPSPLVFRDYLKYMEKKYKSDVQKVNFRYKRPGWSVFSMRLDFKNGQKYIKSKFKDPFLSFFSSGGRFDAETIVS